MNKKGLVAIVIAASVCLGVANAQNNESNNNKFKFSLKPKAQYFLKNPQALPDYRPIIFPNIKLPDKEVVPDINKYKMPIIKFGDIMKLKYPDRNYYSWYNDHPKSWLYYISPLLRY